MAEWRVTEKMCCLLEKYFQDSPLNLLLVHAFRYAFALKASHKATLKAGYFKSVQGFLHYTSVTNSVLDFQWYMVREPCPDPLL